MAEIGEERSKAVFEFIEYCEKEGHISKRIRKKLHQWYIDF